MRISIAANAPHHLPAALAASLGFFQQEGVDAIIETFPSASKTVEALLAGSTEFATTAVEHAIQLAAEGRALRSIALLSARDARAIVPSPARAGIQSLVDLRGRNVGVPGLGSPNYQFALHVLAQQGLKPNEVSFAGVGSGRTLVAALERGMVDAAVVSGADFIRWRMRHPGAPVLVETLTPEGCSAVWNAPSVPFMALWGSPEWIGKHPTQARGVARAVRRALQWMQTHTPEEIRAAVPEEFRSEDPAADHESFRVMKTVYSSDGVMPVKGPEIVRLALGKTQEKIRNANIDLSELYTNEFVMERP